MKTISLLLAGLLVSSAEECDNGVGFVDETSLLQLQKPDDSMAKDAAVILQQQELSKHDESEGPSAFEFGDDGAVGCSSGVVSEDLCLEAVVSLVPEGKSAPNRLTKGRWNHIPTGCSMKKSNARAFWNKKEGGNNGGYRPVCVAPAPAPLPAPAPTNPPELDTPLARQQPSHRWPSNKVILPHYGLCPWKGTPGGFACQAGLSIEDFCYQSLARGAIKASWCEPWLKRDCDRMGEDRWPGSEADKKACLLGISVADLCHWRYQEDLEPLDCVPVKPGWGYMDGLNTGNADGVINKYHLVDCSSPPSCGGGRLTCAACEKGLTVEEFAAEITEHPDEYGYLARSTLLHDPKPVCSCQTAASCGACKAGQSIKQYCETMVEFADHRPEGCPAE